MTARTALRYALAFLATLFLSATAHAQIFRAYLTIDGNDGNNCTLPAPCRLLPAALNAIADGGEVWMLDSANYNTATVVIGKSVSILAVPGAVGSVVATGGPAISITASNLKIALRNLVIVPLTGGGGTDGIQLTGGSTLTIENSLFANLSQNGVNASGACKLKIANSIFRNISLSALRLTNGPYAEISGTQMLDSGYAGVMTYGTGASTTTAIVSDSVVSGGYEGMQAYTSNAGATGRIFVTRSTIEGTNFAIDSNATLGGTTAITVSGSMITNNVNGWWIGGAGATIKSLGNNHIADNTGFVGALTQVGLQ